MIIFVVSAFNNCHICNRYLCNSHRDCVASEPQLYMHLCTSSLPQIIPGSARQVHVCMVRATLRTVGVECVMRF